MPRAFLLVLDSVGIGSAPDAALYGDDGADTVGHIAEACARGEADRDGCRTGPIDLPNLRQLGLGQSCLLATGRIPTGLELPAPPRGRFGCAVERSNGKDTPSGHWELAGVPVPFEWGYFPATVPAFPRDLIETFCMRAGLHGILGNRHASGTEIIDELGEEHVRTEKPICYTSADSVFQIAAHEESFGLERLLEICGVARELVDRFRIGRVIARPFMGECRGKFERTGNRRDYSVPPPSPTMLDNATLAGRDVVTVGKIADIFAHSGTGRVLKANGNDALFDCTLAGAESLADGGLLVANFVEFDSIHGHRRDTTGYAAALEAFDARLPELETLLRPDDLVIVSADHGCDPTWRGTDHTREQVPILAFGPNVGPGCIGIRESFADVGATIAAHIGLPRPNAGSAFAIS
jgi:phosphopentomutase